MFKMFKKLTGLVLISSVAASLIPISANAENGEAKYIEEVLDNYSLAEKYDTSVFEGEHVYLLEENFLENNDGIIGSDSRPNGWDIDRRAGRLRSDGTRICLADGDNTLGISMKHDLMTHKSGDLVLETAIHMKWSNHGGYSIMLHGAGQNLIELVTTDDSKVNYVNTDGSQTAVGTYIKDTDTPVKVVIHPEAGNCDVIVNGQATVGLKLKNNPGVIDQVELKTSATDELTVSPVYCHVYINHFLNERFLSTPIGATPYNFKLNDSHPGETGVEVMQSQRVDTKSYKMTSSKFVGSSVLSAEFNADVNKLANEFYALIPKKHNGIKFQLFSGNTNALTIQTKGQDFVLSNGQVIYKDYKENLWYRFKIITDFTTKTADIYLNYNLVAENVPVTGKVNKISLTSGDSDGAILWVDDILAYEYVENQTGYPEAPEIAKPKDGYHVGMLMYSMWREGFHFGWDRMSPYEERTPYMGYYTEGMAETADWETKWLYEHGVNFQIFTFSSVPRTEDAPIKKPTRSQALIDGLLVGKYKMDFCIMWSTPNEQTIRGLEDFKNNLLPYWVENFFKNPNYLVIDNKLVVYTYGTDTIMNCLGGEANMDIALSMMNEEAKKLGFDGVLFIQNGKALPETLVEKYDIHRYSYAWGDSADDGDAVIKSITSNMETGDKRYIPSVGQGFNTTPWRVGSVGFMTPEESNMMLQTVAQNGDKWEAMGNKMAKTVTLTCWNEWGEGHFYSPSKLYGFDYVNAIRNAFTNEGEKAIENFPTEQSYVRMNVLYPIGRQSLKLMQDQVSKEIDESQLVLLQKFDFSKPEDYARLEIEKNVDSMEQKDGMMVGTSTTRDPSIFINDVNIDATKAKIIKVTAAQENGSDFTVYYQTTQDSNMGVNGKRFANPFASDTNLNLTTKTLIPADTNKLRGTITRLRIDPDDMVMGAFKVQSVEVWGSAAKDVGLYIDGKEYFNNTPIRQVNGTSYMAIQKYCYVTKNYNIEWDRVSGKLHIDTRKESIDLYDGKTNYTINGVEKNFTAAPFYADGNFFVPVREFFEAIGYTVGWESTAGAITLQSPGYTQYITTPPAPLTFEFNCDEYLEGWKMENNYRGWKVEDGILRMSSRADPLSITQTGLGIKGSTAKYAVIRMKNLSSESTIRLYFTNDLVKAYGKDGGYYIPVSTMDKDFKEYVVKLSDNQNFNGNIDNLRFDLPSNDGGIEIDYIRFVESVN